jgi:hypothetical protein
LSKKQQHFRSKTSGQKQEIQIEKKAIEQKFSLDDFGSLVGVDNFMGYVARHSFPVGTISHVRVYVSPGDNNEVTSGISS